MTAPEVRIHGYADEYTAFVQLNPLAPEVRVRRKKHRITKAWTCDTCGPHPKPTCAHQQVAHQYVQETETTP